MGKRAIPKKTHLIADPDNAQYFRVAQKELAKIKIKVSLDTLANMAMLAGRAEIRRQFGLKMTQA